MYKREINASRVTRARLQLNNPITKDNKFRGEQRATVSGYTRGSARTRSRQRGRRMARVAERI